MDLLSDAPPSVNNSNVGNRTQATKEDPELLSIPMVVLLALICLLIVVENSLVMLLMYKKKTLRSLTNMFLASLAFSDLISGLVGIPLIAICSKRHIFKICVSSVIFIRFSAISSIHHVVLIAFDRYVSIVHSFRQESLVTKWRAKGAVAFVWMFSFVASVVQLTWYGIDEESLTDQEGAEKWDATYSLVCLVVFFGFPLILISYMYGRIFYISFKLCRSDRQMIATLQQGHHSVLHEWRGRSVLLIIVVIFAGCWLPFFLAVLGDHVEPLPSESGQASAQRLLLVLTYTPPLLNPLLCTLAKKDFRHAIREMLFKRKDPRRHQEREHRQHFTTEI